MADRLVGLILAGGQSLRMGQPKAWVEWHGLPLLDHVVCALRPQVAKAWVSVHSEADARDTRWAQRQLRAVTDLRAAHCGPLAGIEAALAQLTPQDLLLVCPVDAPNLPTNLGQTLTQALAPEHLAASIDGHHSHLLLRAAALQSVQCALLAGQFALKHWLAGLERAGQLARMHPELFAAGAFRNVNTPGDLLSTK